MITCPGSDGGSGGLSEESKTSCQWYKLDVKGRRHTRVSNLCCYSEAALLPARWKPRQISSCLSQTFSAKRKQVPTLRMPWFPAKKNRGCVSPEKGLLGTATESKERGGSGQLEPHQTLPATLSSQNSSSLWLQSCFSFLQPGPAQCRPLGVRTSPSPPPRFTPGRNIREKQTQPLLL